jgi:hypothetical protein
MSEIHRCVPGSKAVIDPTKRLYSEQHEIASSRCSQSNTLRDEVQHPYLLTYCDEVHAIRPLRSTVNCCLWWMDCDFGKYNKKEPCIRMNPQETFHAELEMGEYVEAMCLIS